MKKNTWQIVIIVVGLLVGIGSLGYSLATANNVELADTMYLVDVETGELYSVDISRSGIALPARHPETKRMVLIRIDKNPDGSYQVSDRDLETLGILDADIKVQSIDRQTGNLISPKSTPKRYVRPPA